MIKKNYGTTYSSESFWNKITNLSGKAGCSLLRTALYLYFILTTAESSPWVKTAIIAALGYFICPIDAIPDFLPGGIGYADDLTIMLSLLNQLDDFVTTDIRQRVNKILPQRCHK